MSSNIDEFKNERKRISKIISQFPYLECKLLEDSGPKPQNAMSSSLNEVKKCDMLVGILGDCDSEITKAEIKEAVDNGKYCLVYKKLKTSEAMDKFVQDSIKQDLTYDEFKEKDDLDSKIRDHLENQIYNILIIGLKCFQEQQKKAKKDSKQAETEARRKIEGRDYKAKAVLQKAKKSLGDGDYLSSVIMCGLSLELALKDWLIKTVPSSDQTIKKRSIGSLVKMIQDAKIIERHYIHNMIEIRMMRNRAMHEARTPSEQDAKTAINWTEELLEKFRI